MRSPKPGISTGREPVTGRIYPDPIRPKPTRMEASSRFWCGFAAGALLGVFLASAFFSAAPLSAAVTVGLTGRICAVLAAPYGEDFWDGLKRVFAWLGFLS